MNISGRVFCEWKKSVCSLGTMLMLTCLLVACKGRVDLQRDHEVFRYNENANITSLDPAFAKNQANLWPVNQVFNGLVQMNNQLMVQPCIASSWEIADSGREYIFHLRNDVLFHDDSCFSTIDERRVTADDFVYSFNRLRSSELAAPGSWIFQNLKSAEARDDSTLILRLQHSFPPFLGLLSMKYASVVPREAVSFYGKRFRSHPVGTGPYYFKLWIENEKLVLRRNPEYFEEDSIGQKLPYLEAIAISFIPDKQAAFMEFVKGELDFLSGLDASYKDELLSFDGRLQDKYAEEFDLYRQDYLNTEYLAFMVNPAHAAADSPLLDVRVRRALNMGFDRVKMMKYLRNDIGRPATEGMIPAGLPSYNADANYGYEYDPDKALELLAEAGFPQGNGLTGIVLQTNSSYLDLCEFIQGELANLGVRISVEVSPPSTLRQAIATSKVPFFRASWIADYPDAENFLSLFYSENHTPDGPNYTHFSNESFDSLYNTALSISDDVQRRKLYLAMDSLVMSEAPVIPLYYDQVLRFYPKHLRGLEGNALNMLDIKYVRKGEPQ